MRLFARRIPSPFASRAPRTVPTRRFRLRRYAFPNTISADDPTMDSLLEALGKATFSGYPPRHQKQIPYTLY
eukprot:3442222-Rhodomonas_salina.1